jgi:hypothetical protein
MLATQSADSTIPLFCLYSSSALQVLSYTVIEMSRSSLSCNSVLHGGSGGWCSPMFSDSYIARLNFIHTDHTALAYIDL